MGGQRVETEFERQAIQLATKFIVFDRAHEFAGGDDAAGFVEDAEEGLVENGGAHVGGADDGLIGKKHLFVVDRLADHVERAGVAAGEGEREGIFLSRRDVGGFARLSHVPSHVAVCARMPPNP